MSKLRERLEHSETQRKSLQDLITVYGWWLQANPSKRPPRDRWVPVMSPRVSNPWLLRTDANGAPTACVLLDSGAFTDIRERLNEWAYHPMGARCRTDRKLAVAAIREAENFRAASDWLRIKLSKLHQTEPKQATA